MNKELEKIQKNAMSILGDYPNKRAKLLEKLTEAEAEKDKAEKVLEAAEDLGEYDRATETIKRADLSIKFTQKELDKMERSPRMNERDYLNARNICRDIMEKAVDNYREKAAQIMGQLKELTDEYQQTAKEVNETLAKLDEGANLLQSKYPDRVTKYNNKPDGAIRDREAWREYALHYDNGTIHKLATRVKPGDRKSPNHSHDSILCAAWGAVIKGYPKKEY